MQSSLEMIAGTYTVNELAAASGRSVQEIVQYAVGDTTKSTTNGHRPSQKNGSRSGPSRPTKLATATDTRPRMSVDVRSPAGRAAYDEVILAHLRNHGDWMLAQKIRKTVGGTVLQVRAALNRLCAGGAIRHKGNTRATKYKIVGA